MSYQLNADGSVVRLWDNAIIPDAEGNSDRQEYREWLKAGNVPLPPGLEEVTLQIADTDRAMARVGEDVINLLVVKGIISLDELPKEAQQVISQREMLRVDLA